MAGRRRVWMGAAVGAVAVALAVAAFRWAGSGEPAAESDRAHVAGELPGDFPEPSPLPSDPVRPPVAPDAGRLSAASAAAPPSVPTELGESPAPGEHVTRLFEGAPPELRDPFDRVARGQRVHPKRAVEVYRFGEDHPGDPRASLVLGYDAMNRSWVEFGIHHYLRAHRADPEVRWDPRLMFDLVRAAQQERNHQDKALAALTTLYGAPDARRALQARLRQAEAAGGGAEQAALEALADALGL
jgi:hypothetical protein